MVIRVTLLPFDGPLMVCTVYARFKPFHQMLSVAPAAPVVCTTPIIWLTNGMLTPLSWQRSSYRLTVTQCPAVWALSKTHAINPASAITAVPEVPHPDWQMPIAPPLSRFWSFLTVLPPTTYFTSR